jgi:magnesium chelatase family protein
MPQCLAETSKKIIRKIMDAVFTQLNRFKYTGKKPKTTHSNGQMNQAQVDEYCSLGQKASELMMTAFEKLKLSGRGYYNVLRVARTIADLEGARKIHIRHLQEALQYTLIIRSDPLGNLEIKN